MKIKSYLLLALLSFNSQIFALPGFDECLLLEEAIKNNSSEYQYNLQDSNEVERVFFEVSNSSYGIGAERSYVRSKEGYIFIDVVPPLVYDKYKINSGDKVVLINGIKTSSMSFVEIEELAAEAHETKANLLINIIDVNGIKHEYDIEYIDIYLTYQPVMLEIFNIASINSLNSTYKSRFRLSASFKLDNLDRAVEDVYQKILESSSEDIKKLVLTQEENFFECFFTKDEYRSLGLWSPQIFLSNIVSSEGDFTSEQLRIKTYRYKEGEEVFYDAEIESVKDSIATFKATFNYKPFPFDRQSLSFNLESKIRGSLFLYFDYDNNKLKKSFESIDLYDWNKKSFVAKTYMADDGFNSTDIGLSYIVYIERNYVYFLTKIYLPIIIILFLAFSILWIRPSELEARLTVSVVCFLALITYTFVIDSDLPKLGYLTTMDLVILISYIFAAIPTIESVYVNNFEDDVDKAISIDKTFRNTLPVLYIVTTLVVIFSTILFHPNAIEALSITT